MEEENKQVASVKCPNPECGKSFKCQLPKKPGKYKLTCPDCKRDFYIQFNPVDIKMEQPKDEEAATVTCPYHCGKTFKLKLPSNDGIYPMKCPNPVCANPIKITVKDGQVAEVSAADPTIVILDTPCCHQKFSYKLKGDGNHKATCPYHDCNHKLTVTEHGGKVIDVKIEGTQIIDNIFFDKAQLSIVRFHNLLGSIGKKVFPLLPGKNTVGRADASYPSTISIEGDKYMSRRSIEIEVTLQESKGYLYKMTILNAANPVLHNNQPLMVGETVYLNYGDRIRLGRTTFNFEKVK